MKTRHDQPGAIPFFKYHALGNDYLVMDSNHIPAGFQLTQELIQRICHRNFGIGSDGILFGPFVTPSERTQTPRLQIFNPDGSEAEKSGNGIRIFSLFLKDQGYVSSDFSLQTLGGLVQVSFLKNEMIRVDMGTVSFESQKIPVSGPAREVIQENLKVGDKEFKVTCLTVGNPHCVIHLPEISETMAREIGPLVENHVNFPKRINLQLMKVLDRNNIQIEIWERGAGYTLASGSSSCAAASAAYRLGLVDASLTVHMPGGKILIDRTPEGHVMMAGSVSRVASGFLDVDLVRR